MRRRNKLERRMQPEKKLRRQTQNVLSWKWRPPVMYQSHVDLCAHHHVLYIIPEHARIALNQNKNLTHCVALSGFHWALQLALAAPALGFGEWSEHVPNTPKPVQCRSVQTNQIPLFYDPVPDPTNQTRPIFHVIFVSNSGPWWILTL